MKKSVGKNYFYNLCYQVLLIIVPIIVTPYLSRILGPDGLGSVSYAESIVYYFVLFGSLGISMYGQRDIAYCQNSIKERSIVFWETKIIEIFSLMLSLILYFCFCFCFELPTIFYVFSLNIIALFFDITWYFRGIEEFGIISFVNVIFKILNVIYTFIFIKNSDDLLKYVAGICLFIFFPNIVMWFFAKGKIIKVKFKELNIMKRLPIIVSLFIPTIASQIYMVLDKTMIGLISGSALENGFYEQANKIVKLALTVFTSFGTALLPKISFLFMHQKFVELKKWIYISYKFTLFLGLPMCMGMIALSDYIIPWFLGNEFLDTIPILKILSVLLIIAGINNVSGIQYLVVIGKQKVYTIITMVGLFCNFSLNLFMIKFWGALGAAYASIISESIICILLFIYIRKDFSIKKILKNNFVYLIASFVMFSAVVFLKNYFYQSFFSTLVLFLIGIIIYFGFLLVCKDKFVLKAFKYFRQFRMN